MVFGPFGVSLAPQIRASRTLSKFFAPLAQSFARISGHRQMGLRYDDLLIEERDDVAKALQRLSPAEQYDRAWRIRRAVQLSILHQNLPKDQWTPVKEDTRYLTPVIENVVKEDEERKFWDNVEPIRA
ncbi:ubiquinol-cytochrome-c reductase complex subunit 6 [Cantharellus anzutake]|uniref:ubiquinol-cytochrome-c reductase complex subunit 6 n=1 Tax=Cantharellus anzutake TaxID=1750568 RepID=UPI0019073877|nr:ubiquinol-cytochrome-c reductase complex subunit 6 [Cantharellus anzutake]KAF8326352.1 ubiquinol-cytochrome-c reductase complex subunit 6 [Cantharellus anzutake]